MRGGYAERDVGQFLEPGGQLPGSGGGAADHKYRGHDRHGQLDERTHG